MEIKISPSAEVVELLTDLDEEETAYWLGRELPESAALRLDRYQRIATERILEEVPRAEVIWSSDLVRTSGCGEQVEVSVDDEGATQERVQGILDRTCEEVSEAPSRPPTTTDTVMNLLRALARGATMDQLCEATGRTTRTVLVQLSHLEQAGVELRRPVRAGRVEAGQYRLASEALAEALRGEEGHDG